MVIIENSFDKSSNYIEDIKKLLLTNNNIKLIKYSEYISNITFTCIITLDFIANIIIEITTDFDTFCYYYIDKSISNDIKNIIDNINLSIICQPKLPNVIIKELNKISTIYTKNNLKLNNFDFNYDPFHINQKIEFYKYYVDYNSLEEKLLNNTNIIYSIQKNKLNYKFSEKQVVKLIISEIKLFNSNKNYDHYILINDNCPYELIIRLKFKNDSNISKLLNIIFNKFNYDYIEFTLNIDSILYPLIPPKFTYCKPHIDFKFLAGLLDLNIFKLENWNQAITLEYLIINIANQFEMIGYNYINIDADNNLNMCDDNIIYEIIQLINISKYSIDKIDIKIDIVKIINTKNKISRFPQGTGYNINIDSNWNIINYIQQQEKQSNEIINHLNMIIKIIKNNNINYLDFTLVFIYIKNKIIEINLLELYKNINLYHTFFLLLELLYNLKINTTFIIDIGKSISELYCELQKLIEKNDLNTIYIIDIYNIIKLYYNYYIQSQQNISEINKNDSSLNKSIIIDSHIEIEKIKDEYCNIMKNIQFDICELYSNHKYYIHKDQKPDRKALVRILSEISSFKSALPLNWDSTIWVRIPKNNYNIFTFLISGPKDSPYENGLFEFHAYFPNDYPNSVPLVEIYTTGGNTVRFNPNLYSNGKVCLSLLNTWTGSPEEKWNPKTSTFLQVMISIQSLILIENPYYNEPGWEKNLGTEFGKQQSNIYNQNLYPNTIKFAMIDMIRNPPDSFKDVIKYHFKFKKDEIIKRITNWEHNSDKTKNDIIKYKIELLKLLDEI